MPTVSHELLRSMPLTSWEPRIGDFVIYHGWFNKWYGVVAEVNKSTIIMRHEGLPLLLASMRQDEQEEKKIEKRISEVRSSRGGKYAVLQDKVWFIDA